MKRQFHRCVTHPKSDLKHTTPRAKQEHEHTWQKYINPIDNISDEWNYLTSTPHAKLLMVTHFLRQREACHDDY